MSRSPLKKSKQKSSDKPNPFKRITSSDNRKETENRIYFLKSGIRCDTDHRGSATPGGLSPAEIVLDASEGFIPLWAKDTILRWRFRDSSFELFENKAAAKSAVEKLLGRAIIAWGDAAPIKFAKRDDAWDFEIVMRSVDDCDLGGCVLASAFFPDAGRHQLMLYPKMFEQPEEEQIETLAHEIGHIFGLRHFFALVSEQAWPAEVFGTHSKFSIMNYGVDSKLTPEDRSDLKHLYQLAWTGQLSQINGTPIKLVRPFHVSGVAVESPFAIAAVRTVIGPLPGA